MPERIWLRCVIVSFAIACFVPLFTNVMLVPEDSEMVVDLSAIDPDEMSRMSDEKFQERMSDIPMRRIEGFERLTYPFTHPQYARFYVRGVILAFTWILLATLIVSFLNFREIRHGQKT